MMEQANAADTAVEPLAEAAPRSWLRRWWALLDLRLGIVPLPVAIIVIGVIAGHVMLGKLPSDILTNIAVLATGGFACAELGKRMPLLRHLGLAAICATFIPSYLEYVHALPEPVIASISAFTDSSNFLYLFIASVVVGSVFGIDRQVLVSGFVKIFVPLALGSVVAGVTGCLVGTALGLGLEHTFFKIVVPIMAGGVGEGAIPLSIGYAAFSSQPQGEAFAEILPAVMLGSLTAIILSGGLNFLGKRFPHLTGEGRLQPGEPETSEAALAEVAKPVTPQTVGAAIVTVVTLYMLGGLAQELWHWPGPVVMLGLAILIKLGRLVSPSLERGAHANYQFFSACVTYPLLFAIGVAKTPWEKLIAAFNLPTITTIVATVTALMATGFAAGRWVNLYPIEAAIINATHSGQGGTGDVAILTAANRMRMMPFAQIATRIGGGITVTLALIAFAHLQGRA